MKNTQRTTRQQNRLKDPVFMVEGLFSIHTVDRFGKKTLHFREKNMIVNGARKIMAHAIVPKAEDQTEFAGINRFKLGGDNDITAAEYLTPILPVQSDITLPYIVNLFTRNYGDTGADLNVLFDFSFPNTPNEVSALFTIQIERTEGHDGVNPFVYSSAGLYSYDENEGTETLFSAQSFPAVILGGSGATRSLIIDWEISF